MNKSEFVVHPSGEKSFVLREALSSSLISSIVAGHPRRIIVEAYVPWKVSDVSALRCVVHDLWVQDPAMPAELALGFNWISSLHLDQDAGGIDFGVFADLEDCALAHQKALPETLYKCSKLKSLSLIYSKLGNVDSFGRGLAIEKLVVDSPPLPFLEIVSSMRNLRHFGASRCKARDLAFLSQCTQLEYCSLSMLPKLESLDGIDALSHMWNLDLANCPKLSDLEPLSRLVGLKKLLLESCPKIASLVPIAKLAKLEKLMLWENTLVEDGDLRCMLQSPSLQEFTFKNRRSYNISMDEMARLLNRTELKPS
ncbi:MAG TPA: hypothetical protein PKY24_09790 [Opitutaceae bacterium]|jgi:hypothetical protein|nr:hypothetical protein [Opitutaceae bacterium]HPK49955.1 hypothetical protein [Opitutaceae bacterium]